ncbi:DUF2922 domain-containing protein [Pontibacillus yanchengensis]|uniref:Potassium channel protein n=1 Tax=Pontibacillus yanchengensis Y32 TaxID=1385514 RepID=A0A0A2TG61_9BACI|nr:DUF2922 domain-containing protein [Pontibacillus yanchengensis]KGP74549.1 hypothetical protein N782_00200 [Pontibacillus yanchengensis Y32]
MAKKLELKFLNEENRTVTISMDQPIEPVDPVAVNAAMDEIITQGCFFSSGGNLISKKEARIVERNVFDVQL